MELITNKSKTNPEHRMVFAKREIRDFIIPRFGYMVKGFKFVKWGEKQRGLELYYRTIDGVLKVGIMESGYGIPPVFYTKEELAAMLTEQPQP